MMDKKENNEQEVVAVLRSVVQSAKGGVLVANLHSEYEFLVGEKVPFKALGYVSLEAMLRSMPEIVNISRNSYGEAVVNAVADESTAHIASLISRQRNAKTNPRRPPRRRPMTMSHYSKPQASQYLPRMNAKKQHSTNFSSRAPRNMQNVTLSKATADGQPSVSQKSSFNRRQLPARHPNLPPRLLAQSISSPSFGQTSTSPANFLLKQPLPSSPPILSPPATPPPLQPLSSSLLLSRTSLTSPAPPLLTSSVSPPPLLTSSGSPPPLLTSSASPPPLLTSSVSPPPLYCPPSSMFDSVEVNTSSHFYHDVASYRDLINSYAASKGLKVTYRSLPLNPKEVPRTYVSTLMIAKQKFNSYPHDMRTIEQAEEEAARVAVESLNILAGQESESLPTSSVDTMENRNIILKRVLNIINGKTNGLWSMKVESVYKETYNEVLPSDWLDVVTPDITINRIGPNRSILYPSQRNHIVENSDVQTKQETGLPDPLPLPDGECWDVFVSYLTSSVDVCIQLVEHSESYQNLVEEMQSYYENNGNAAKKVEDGKLYALNNEEYWHRIRVTNIMTDKVECYFVDHGDSCITDISCLYELLPRFSTLPFQALHCQLDDLVDYAENKIMLHHLTDKNLLLGKTLVAKVISRDDPVSLVFYDTTTDEDININEHLLKITEKDYITPQLPKIGGITKAYLSHVDRDGDVYVRVSGNALDLLKNLMDEFNNQCTINTEFVKSVSNDKMYCIKYMDNWYRAIVKILPFGDAYKEVEMLCVDYGNCVTVSKINIYELGQLSDELTGLPFQALKCRLYGISPAENEEWSKQTIKQLLKLAPENQVLLLKVITAATEDLATNVELFKRIEPNDELVSINQTIAMSGNIISTRENLTTSNGILRNNRMDERCLKPLDLRLDFEEPVSSLTSINNPIQCIPLQEENKLSKHYSVITPDGIGEQVDDVLEHPPLVPTTIPTVGEYFDVHVINAAHPFNFTCQPYKQGTELDMLFKEMQTFYSSEEHTIDMDKCLLKVGQFYAGKNEKNEWHRVCVKKIFVEVDRDIVVFVYFVDYGGYTLIGLSDLQPLWRYFRTLPFQAIPARLFGIEPPHSDWSISDCVEFKKLVEGKEFVSVIKAKKLDKTNHGVQELSLILIDTSENDDVNINQLLVSLNIAVRQTTKR